MTPSNIKPKTLFCTICGHARVVFLHLGGFVSLIIVQSPRGIPNTYTPLGR